MQLFTKNLPPSNKETSIKALLNILFNMLGALLFNQKQIIDILLSPTIALGLQQNVNLQSPVFTFSYRNHNVRNSITEIPGLSCTPKNQMTNQKPENSREMKCVLFEAPYSPPCSRRWRIGFLWTTWRRSRESLLESVELAGSRQVLDKGSVVSSACTHLCQ